MEMCVKHQDQHVQYDLKVGVGISHSSIQFNLTFQKEHHE